MHQSQQAIYCLASFFKGNDFLRECKRLNHRVYLVTREKLGNEDWAWESLDGIIKVPDKPEIEDYVHAVSDFARFDKPTRIVALEESDVVTAARIREHFCLDGAWSSEAKLFRDKLAMRQKLAPFVVPQPSFVHAVNYQEVGEFMERIESPWVIKPRADASSIGIKQLSEREQVWNAIDRLNQNSKARERSGSYLIEQFIAGDVFHVDSLINRGKILVACPNRYGNSPLEISVNGGISTSVTVDYDSPIRQELLDANSAVLKSLGLNNGVAHAEFIKSHKDGNIYFLEIGARVGGAYTAEAFEAATGLNLWREWARIESSGNWKPYNAAPLHQKYGAILVSLARTEFPDTSAYNDPEICHRPKRAHHVGLVLCSDNYRRINELVESYRVRFEKDFLAVAPQPERPD